MCADVPLCSNNRSKGKLGITFHRISVDKYAKESWIVRIRGDVGKNFQVSDCGLRLQAKQALSVINLFKVIWSTRIICRAELLFYYVPSVLLLPVIKRYNCSLDFEKQRFARNILNHQTFERPSLENLKKGSVPSAFVDCLEKALSRALSNRAQKELNLSSNYTRIPEKVVRKSADGLKYSEQTLAFLLLEI